jgi:predicted acylesterase/phospholipase RssA
MGAAVTGAGASALAVCRGGARDDAATAWVADYVRFEAAVERAADEAASLLAGGLVTVENVAAGAARAFKQTAQYLRDRGWSRSFRRKTLALVTKGGASTGVFTAGATWAVLNLVNECTKKGDPSHAWCSHGGDDDFRFQLMSGTSTGALVATVVDVYNTQSTYPKRRDAMTNIAQWFTCSAMNDLYCIRSAPLLDLVRSPGGQDSLLDFDGLTKKLRDAVHCSDLRNSSELIVNTTDFRSGRLLALSDQEEFALRTREDVVQGAIASAALPFIVRPVYKLPSNYDASVPAAYLDGGIRSEIPIMPVVRRGAERVLVIGSDAPVGGETSAIPNALGMATRYIDVTLSGVIETELAESQTYAQSLRLAEMDVCLDATAPQTAQTDAGALAGACAAADSDCRSDLCQGHWDDLCRPAHPQGAAGAPPSGSPPPASSGAGRAQVRPQLSARLEPFWKMVTLFRDERRVEPLHGYTFDPPEQRRLFLAGADAIRVSCLRVAGLLGIPVPDDPGDPRRAQLASWCAPALDAGVCGVRAQGGPPSDCAGPIAAPAPDLLVDCRQNEGAP